VTSLVDVVADHLHAPTLKKPLEKNNKDDHHQWTRKIVFAIGLTGAQLMATRL
jgi:hypothetical protein